MIYDSLDNIPAKVFFKIVKTGNVQLLTDEEVDEKKLNEIWDRLENEDAEKNPEVNKYIDVWKYIEYNLSKLRAINNAVFYLRIKEDEELIDLLKSYQYKFSGDLNKDLDKVEKYSKGILLTIETLKSSLPERNENDVEIPFDEVVIGYGILSGAGFIDTNKITKNQYDALITIGNQKIKALGKNGKRR